MRKAKLFPHGGSQAVRLPEEFRHEGSEIHLRRVGGEVMLSTAPPGADISFDALLDALEAFGPGTSIVRDQPHDLQRSSPPPDEPGSAGWRFEK
jgi:antitoxin VapB